MKHYPSDLAQLFGNLSPDQLSSIDPLFIQREEPTGTVLFEQGDPAECIYILVEGTINIRYKPEDGPALIIARVRAKGVVGWSAALGNPNYTSSAVCGENCRMLCVQGKDLRDLYEEEPILGGMIIECLAVLIAERLRNTHDYVIGLLQQGLRIQLNGRLAKQSVRESMQ